MHCICGLWGMWFDWGSLQYLVGVTGSCMLLLTLCGSTEINYNQCSLCSGILFLPLCYTGSKYERLPELLMGHCRFIITSLIFSIAYIPYESLLTSMKNETTVGKLIKDKCHNVKTKH